MKRGPTSASTKRASKQKTAKPRSTESRLRELLQLKDDRISELESDAEEIREAEEREEWRWSLPRKVTNDERLAVPRLEIRCVPVSDNWYNFRWDYALIYKHLLGHLVAVPFGSTTCNSSAGRPPVRDGKIHTPFRDGVHIAQDSLTLRLPAFALCDGIIELIEMVDGKIKTTSVPNGE